MVASPRSAGTKSEGGGSLTYCGTYQRNGPPRGRRNSTANNRYSVLSVKSSDASLGEKQDSTTAEKIVSLHVLSFERQDVDTGRASGVAAAATDNDCEVERRDPCEVVVDDDEANGTARLLNIVLTESSGSDFGETTPRYEPAPHVTTTARVAKPSPFAVNNAQVELIDLPSTVGIATSTE